MYFVLVALCKFKTHVEVTLTSHYCNCQKMDNNISAFAKYNKNSLSKTRKVKKGKSKKRHTSESVDSDYANKKKLNSKRNSYPCASIDASASNDTLNSSSVVQDNVVGLKQNGLSRKGKKLLAKKKGLVGIEDACPTLVDVGRTEEEGRTLLITHLDLIYSD